MIFFGILFLIVSSCLADNYDNIVVIKTTIPPGENSRPCTGVLIKSNWILTSGSCVENAVKNNGKIVSLNANVNNKNIELKDKIAEIKIHKKYDFFTNNIALIKLKENIEETIPEIKLPENNSVQQATLVYFKDFSNFEKKTEDIDFHNQLKSSQYSPDTFKLSNLNVGHYFYQDGSPVVDKNNKNLIYGIYSRTNIVEIEPYGNVKPIDRNDYIVTNLFVFKKWIEDTVNVGK